MYLKALIHVFLLIFINLIFEKNTDAAIVCFFVRELQPGTCPRMLYEVTFSYHEC